MSCCFTPNPSHYPPSHGACCASKNDCTFAKTKWYAVALLVVSIVVLGITLMWGLGLFSSGAILQKLAFVATQMGFGGSVALFAIGCILGSVGTASGAIWLAKSLAALCEVTPIEGINAKTVNERDSTGHTPLHEAIRNNRLEAIQLLWDKGASNAYTPSSTNAVCYAFSCKQEEAAKILMKNGAHINFQGNPNFGPCHTAVINRDLDQLKTLVKYGADVNMKGRNGDTSLHIAARWGYLEIVQELFANNASVDIQNNEGETALHLASALDDLALVKELLAQGARADIPGNGGDTPLHAAVKRGYLRIVQTLLLEKKNGVNLQNKQGKTALHVASANGDLAMVEELLVQGARADIPDNDGNTPLHVVVHFGRLDLGRLQIIRALLNKDSINLQNKQGKTALHMALTFVDLLIANELLAQGAHAGIPDNDGNTPLHLVANWWESPLDIIQALLVNKADLNSQNKQGNTALSYAIGKGKIAFAKELLTLGANANIPNDEGNTPLHIAAFHGYSEIIEPLAKSAHVNSRNMQGKTALRLCLDVRNTLPIIIQELVKQGVNVDIPDKHGVTPLIAAISLRCNLETIQQLLASKANVNVQVLFAGNSNVGSGIASGVNALWLAYSQGNVALVKELVAHHARVDIRGRDGYTLLHRAVIRGEPHMLSIFLESNCDVNIQDNRGQTPLHLAILTNNRSLIDPLLSNDSIKIDIADNEGKTPFDIAVEKRLANAIEATKTFRQKCLEKINALKSEDVRAEQCYYEYEYNHTNHILSQIPSEKMDFIR